MSTSTRVRSCLLYPLLLAEPSAQAPAAPPTVLAQDLRVPIHSHPDDPVLGPYGLWAAGPDYKASFHDGFAFHPYLGSGYAENLPFTWRTESIAVGGETLVTAATGKTTRTGDWRHEVHYPGVVEAYDVRPDGVEQTFQLRSPPVRHGDWVVTGRITTRLLAPSRLPAAHQELVFTDAAGNPLVRYGAATAIDADGDRHPVTTAWDGERVRLSVDGAWLATARFPVLLDPLTAAVQVYALGSQGARELEIASAPEATPGARVMVVFTRVASATDRDVYGVLTTPGLAGGSVVFSFITSGDANRPAVAYSAAMQRWAIVFQQSTPSSSTIHAWIQDRDATSMAGGSMHSLPLTAPGTVDRYPDIGAGGSSAALVVYQTDVTASGSNTPNSEVHCVILDVNVRSFGTPFRVANQAAGTRYDREYPAVSQTSWVAPIAWVVVWQELDRGTGADDWDIWARRVTSSGGRLAFADLTAGIANTSNKVRPQVDGDSGRFMATFLMASSGDATEGPEVRTVRFDAPESGSAITNLVQGVLRTSTARLYSELAIAYDPSTDSHWAIACQSRGTTSPAALPAAHLDRVGFTGGPVESTTLVSNALSGFSPAVTCQRQTSQEANRFLAVYLAPAGLSSAIYGRELTYAAAPATGYGTACGTGAIGSDVPRAGTEDFTVSLRSAPVSVASVLLLSYAQGSTPLDLSGMTGCVLNLAPGFFLPFVSTTNGGGNSAIAFPLPDRPAFFGDLYFQWIYVSSGANPANLQATQGLRAQVR